MQPQSSTPPSPHSLVPRVCRHCGVSFLARPNRVKKGAAIYCSRSCYATGRTVSTEERFWRYVAKGEPPHCWLWTGAATEAGYGVFSTNDAGQWKNVLAHRYSYELHHGPIPDGLYVCHNCPGGDNPACCNPAHLLPGTHQDNMRDATEKGRMRKGERNYFAKLTDADAAAIRATYAAGGVTQACLAQRYGVAKGTIRALVNGRTWRPASPS